MANLMPSTTQGLKDIQTSGAGYAAVTTPMVEGVSPAVELDVQLITPKFD